MNKLYFILVLLFPFVAFSQHPPTAWDDVYVPALTARAPASGYPDVDAFPAGSSTQTYLFDKTTDQCVFMSLQLPHGYLDGYLLSPHVHWSPVDNGAGNVTWSLDYTIISIGGTFVASQNLYIKQATGTTANKHNVAEFTDIAGTGLTLSAIMVARVCRDANGSLDTDDYDNDAALLGFDIHTLFNSLGSRLETAR